MTARLGRLWVLVGGLLGCGRVAFEAPARTGDAALATDATADSSIPPGAVFYLPFEGGAIDVAGGHAVVCRTTCPSATPGVHGDAYAFSAAGPDVLLAPYAPDLDPSGGFTLAVWLYFAAFPTTTYYCVLGKPVGGASFNSHALCVDMAGNAFYHSGTTAGTDNLVGTFVGVNAWHHLAMTWDGTTKRGYVDGVLDGMRDVMVENDTSPLSIGADLNNGTPAYSLTGWLDEVLVFDRALSAAEIQQLAQ